MPSSATKKHVPGKYCGILHYVQFNNPELYETIGDLLCMPKIFSTRYSGPGKPSRELTFLMPIPGSPMHKAIVDNAYSGRQQEAIAMVKSCLITKCINSLADFKQGDVLHTAAHANVIVDTSGGFTKVGGAKIIADENFATLYTDAKFHVYLLVSEILMTTPGDEPRATTTGGAWKDLREEKEVAGAFMRTPAGLAQSAMQTHIVMLKSNGSLSAAMPAWIGVKPNEVFYKWGVSLGKYLEGKQDPALDLAKKMWTPNPMCLIPFCSMILDRKVFDAWLLHEDPDNMEYTYEEYLKFVPKTAITEKAAAESTITSAVQSIAGPQKSIIKTATIVQQGYQKVYGNDFWRKKLSYDEAVFIMNDYITAAIGKDFDRCEKLSGIIVRHFAGAVTPGKEPLWLANTSDGAHDASPMMHCKLVQFVLSEAFMYPNAYCEGNRRPAPLEETSEGAAKYMKLPPECIDFTSHIKAFFGGR
jgi:hypothetical protein